MDDHAPARLSRPDSRQMLPPEVHDLAPQPMSLDVEQPGGIRLIPSGDFEHAGDQEPLRFGQAQNCLSVAGGLRRRQIVQRFTVEIADLAGQMGRADRAIRTKQGILT
jgi:hypothetical protein